MGLIKKAANFTVLSIEGLGEMTPVEIEAALSKGRIKDIKGMGDSEAFGFCKVNDPFDFALSYGSGVLGFGLRHDKKKISKGLFKKLYRAELRQTVLNKQTTKKVRLSKEEKQYAREEVLARMYSEATPIEKVAEVILNSQDGVAFLGTTNPYQVDGFCQCLKKVLPEAEVTVWNPKAIEHETKGTKENYQNALLTWILSNSLNDSSRGWVPQSAKFFDGVSTISVKSDQELPTEAWFSSFKDRVVDAISFSLIEKDRGVDLSLSRGSWCFRGVKFSPEIAHEDVESALFERFTSLSEVVSRVKKIVEEFNEIRGTDKESAFWEQMHIDAKEKIKSEVEQ
jgi:hypothetical protein